MSLEAIKPKNHSEDALETEVLEVEKNDTEATRAVDRLKTELKLEGQKETEIKRGKDIEDIRQGLGLEKEENQEIFIEAEAFLKKLSIPFEDEAIDKKRQELLKEAQDKINPNLKSLEDNKQRALDIKKEKEELSEKMKELEVQKEEKEKELQALRNEAQEYIDKTKPPIFRASTREKLARAKGIIQYFEKREQRETGPFFDYDKSIGVDYKLNAESGFNESREKSEEVKKITSELVDSSNLNYEKDKELKKVEEDLQNKKTSIETNIEDGDSKLELLKSDHGKIDKKREIEDFNTKKKEKMFQLATEVISVLLPEKKKNLSEISPLIKEKQKVTQERSDKNILKKLSNFLFLASVGTFEKLGINNEQEAIERLKEEVKKVEESASITINISDFILLRHLGTGKFKSTLEESDKLKNYSNDLNTTVNRQIYEDRRIETEKGIGVYANGTEEDPYAIVGAVASNNGYDESHGGAGMYAENFVTLKPEVIERSVFIDGDSMGEVLNFENKPGLNKEAAILAKAMHNIEDKVENKMGEFLRYVEVNILGGVKIDDIESINIKSPDKLLEEYHQTGDSDEHLYESYKNAIDLISKIKKNYPQYAHLIKEV